MRSLVEDSLGFNECQLATCSDNPPMVVNSKQLSWILKRRDARLASIPSPCKMKGRSLHALRRHQNEMSKFTKKGKK